MNQDSCTRFSSQAPLGAREPEAAVVVYTFWPYQERLIVMDQLYLSLVETSHRWLSRPSWTPVLRRRSWEFAPALGRLLNCLLIDRLRLFHRESLASHLGIAVIDVVVVKDL